MEKKFSNDLAILLDEIQAVTNLNMEEVAKRIGKTRPYLSARKALKENDETNEKLIQKLRIKFAKELGERVTEQDRDKGTMASLTVLFSRVAYLESLQTGEPAEVILRRLQKSAEEIEKML